jgi:predicted nucleotide-binding protein (sugar kinase/HSP70/actin superfamily)
MGYRIRPYEIEPGATNRALEEAKRIIYQALYEQTNVFVALNKCRPILEAVKVDKLRPKAKSAIIGEFWAMTTEGDGNYGLQRFLEQEGAEDDIQLVSAWLLYNIWEASNDTKNRAELRGTDHARRGLKDKNVAQHLAILKGADAAVRLIFHGFAALVGLSDYHLPDMWLVADAAKDLYNTDLRGGEGHMEVGKLILNVEKKKANMTVSVKPFGCMPSSGVSDGVQTVVTERYPEAIYCAVETSGDGATNFYSRVQMFLFKARLSAREELQRSLDEAGLTLEQCREFLAKSPKYGSPMFKPHHSYKYASTAANLVYEIAPLIKLSRGERAVADAKAALEKTKALYATAVEKAPAAYDFSKKVYAEVKENWPTISKTAKETLMGLGTRMFLSAKEKLSLSEKKDAEVRAAA